MVVRAVLKHVFECVKTELDALEGDLAAGGCTWLVSLQDVCCQASQTWGHVLFKGCALCLC